MNSKVSVRTSIALMVVLGLTWVAAVGVNAEDFYKGKRVRIIVGYSPGGGYDTYARMIARHIDRHIPNKPGIIVQNMPGAGGLVSANYVYNLAPRDGTAVLHVGGSTILKQLAGDDGVKYDALKFHYLGAPFTEGTVLVVTKKSGIGKFEDTLGENAKELVLGGISAGSPQDVATILLRDVLGARVRLISGYAGTSMIRAAMERGELDGMFNSWASLRATSLDKITSGEWLVLAYVNEHPFRDLPHIPSIMKFAKTEDQRQLVRLATLVPYQFARAFYTTPAVPMERVKILQSAFERTLADKQYLMQSEKAGLINEPIGGNNVRSFVQEFLTMPESLKSKVLKIVNP